MTTRIHVLTHPAGDVSFSAHSRVDPSVVDAWRSQFDARQLARAMHELAHALGSTMYDLDV